MAKPPKLTEATPKDTTRMEAPREAFPNNQEEDPHPQGGHGVRVQPEGQKRATRQEASITRSHVKKGLIRMGATDTKHIMSCT